MKTRRSIGRAGRSLAFAVLAVAAAGAMVATAAGTASAADGSGAADEPLPGQALYQQHCVTCHGTEGKGDGPAGREIVPMPRDFSVGQFKFDADADGQTGTDRDLFLVIRNGAAAVGGNPLMTPWAHLGDERIRELVAYVRSLEQPRGASR